MIVGTYQDALAYLNRCVRHHADYVTALRKKLHIALMGNPVGDGNDDFAREQIPHFPKNVLHLRRNDAHDNDVGILRHLSGSPRVNAQSLAVILQSRPVPRAGGNPGRIDSAMGNKTPYDGRGHAAQSDDTDSCVFCAHNDNSSNKNSFAEVFSVRLPHRLWWGAVHLPQNK